MRTSPSIRRLLTLAPAAGLLLVVPAQGSAADAPPVGLASRFTEGPGGFTTGYRRQGEWRARGGSPGGFVLDVPSSNPTTSPLAVDTPRRWSGDRRGAYGGRLTFDVRAEGFSTVSVALVAPGQLLSRDVTVAPGGWVSVTVPLRADGTWLYENRVPQGEPTPDEFRGVLSDLRVARIGSDGPRVAGQRLSVDDVVLAGHVRRTTSLLRTRRGADGRVTLGGRVRSPQQVCTEDVAVRVVRLRPGADAFVALTRTDAGAEWGVRDALPAGRYRAEIASRFEAGAGDCGATTSRTVRLP